MAGNDEGARAISASRKEWEQFMISYVKGPLMGIDEDSIIVEAGNVGLAIRVPASLQPELPRLGEEVTIYTYFQVFLPGETVFCSLSQACRNSFKEPVCTWAEYSFAVSSVYPCVRNAI